MSYAEDRRADPAWQKRIFKDARGKSGRAGAAESGTDGRIRDFAQAAWKRFASGTADRREEMSKRSARRLQWIDHILHAWSDLFAGAFSRSYRSREALADPGSSIDTKLPLGIANG